MIKLVTTEQLKIIRLKELIELTALSRSTIYNKIDSSSSQFDSEFPIPISLGASSVGWIASEVNLWINSKIQQRNQTIGQEVHHG
jgi:prophage regulatory protein